MSIRRLGPCVIVALGSAAAGQPSVEPPSSDAPVWLSHDAASPDDPRLEAYRAANKTRVELERELYRIRAQHFRNMRNVQIRQVGIQKLREYTEPAIFPSLLEIFAREKQDVRGAILDHLMDQRSEHGDATLAWAAINDADAWFRAEAARRLVERTRQEGEVPAMVRSVVASGLRRTSNAELAASAKLAETLRLFEAIPMLINAQIGGGTTAAVGGSGQPGSLGWILIGTQQAFVSDLQPVVGDSAVAFDPQLSVVTEGTYLRVIDAAVVTYRVDVHNALMGLSSAGWGRPTGFLGWDNRAWREWYAEEFLPHLARAGGK